MANATIKHFQAWEYRIKEWLNQSDDELILSHTKPVDRRILVVLTIKYHIFYLELHELKEVEKSDEEEEKMRVKNVKLRKRRLIDRPLEKEDLSRTLGQRCQLFTDLTGRFLEPVQAAKDISLEWKDFSVLCDWYSLEFLQKFDHCLRQLVAQCIAETPAYQKLISEPPVISPVKKIRNRVYAVQNENQIYLSIDMKSANYSLLKNIGAVDGNAFPTWQDFLEVFIGARPSLLSSKKFRMRSLGLLPQYYKLEAIRTQLTATVYRDILNPYFTERKMKVECVGLEGDEIVFHLKLRTDRELIKLIHEIQQQLKENPHILFVVQAYRLQLFHWKNQHTCFVRLFLDSSNEKFDLKCVPDKDKNYDQAYADYRSVRGCEL